MNIKRRVIGILCLLLVTGIWIFVAPEKTEAATITSLTGTETYTTVTWSKQKQVKGYVIYRQVNGEGNFVKIATLSKNARSYTDSNDIILGNTYSYKVGGVSKRGAYKFNDTQKVKIVDDYGVTQITSLVNNGTSATLNWKKSSYASFYNIYRKAPSGSFKSIGSVSGTSTSFKDTKVKPGIEYTYSIRATKKLSSKIYFRGKYDNKGIDLLIKKPSGVNGDFTTLNTIVKWKPMEDVTGYQVRRKLLTTGSYRTIATLDASEPTEFKDVYYNTLSDEEKKKEPLTAVNYYDPAINPLVYTVRAYKIVDSKTSYGAYDSQGVMLTEAPTITNVKVYKKKRKQYIDVSFSMLKNANVYKVYGGTKDNEGKRHWTLLGTVKSPKWKYGDYTKTIKSSKKYSLYTVKAGFPMNGTTYSKYDTGFDVSNKKYSNQNVLFFGDSITFGSPYKGVTTVKRFGYPWRVNQLTGCKWFNPSIPGATYTDKFQADGRMDPDRSRLATDVADKINAGKTPVYNTWKPVSDASGQHVKDNVPTYAQTKNTQHFYDFDVVIMAAGTNDWQDNAPLGDIDSKDRKEFYGAVNSIMDQLTEASKIRVKKGKEPIKVVFTELYYSSRMTGHYAEINDRDFTENKRGYTLLDYQKALDNICDKYHEEYGMQIYKMPTREYCNKNNAPYVMSDNLHMSKFTYGQIGNGMSEFLISKVFRSKASQADKEKILAFEVFEEIIDEVIETTESTEATDIADNIDNETNELEETKNIESTEETIIGHSDKNE